MYKAPTLSTAAFYATSAQTQPKRQSTVLCDYYTTNSKDLSRGNFVSNSNGSPALLKYMTLNGRAKQDARAGGLIALSSDEANFTDQKGSVEQGYVRCEKPFYITQDNRVFSNSEITVFEKIEELKSKDMQPRARLEETEQDKAKRARSPMAYLHTSRATSRCFNEVLRNLYTRKKSLAFARPKTKKEIMKTEHSTTNVHRKPNKERKRTKFKYGCLDVFLV